MQDDSKYWKNKIHKLKDHTSSLDLEGEWRSMEKRMNKNKRRKIALWWWPVMVGVGMILGLYFTAADTPDVHNVQNESAMAPVSLHEKARVAGENNILNRTPAKSTMPHMPVSVIMSKGTNQPVGYSRTAVLKIQSINKESSFRQSTNDSALKSEELQTELHDNDIDLRANEKNTYIESPILGSAPINNTGTFDHPSNTGRNTPVIAKLENMEFNALISMFQNIELMDIEVRNHFSKPIFIDVRTLLGAQIYRYRPVSAAHEKIALNRHKYEKPLETVSTRLAFGKEIGSSFYVTIGVSYAKMNDRWKSSRLDTADIIIDNQIIERYINQEGFLVEKTGSKMARQIVEVTQIRYNSMETFATTISLGKYFNIHKMRWMIEGSILIPCITKYTGQAPDQFYQMASLQSIYKSSTLQYGMHLSYLYPVSENLMIYGGYEYNQSRLVTSTGYFRDQQIHALSIGMKYFIYQ